MEEISKNYIPPKDLEAAYEDPRSAFGMMAEKIITPPEKKDPEERTKPPIPKS